MVASLDVPSDRPFLIYIDNIIDQKYSKVHQLFVKQIKK